MSTFLSDLFFHFIVSFFMSFFSVERVADSLSFIISFFFVHTNVLDAFLSAVDQLKIVLTLHDI